MGGRRPLPSQPTLLLACGLAAPILFVATFLVEGATRPGYNAWTDYVSELSLGIDGWMQVADFIASGWLLLAFSTAVYQAVRIGAAPRLTPIVFSVMGFGLIAAGAFPTDPVAARLTLHGELHTLATAIIAGSAALGCILAWEDLRRDRRRSTWARWYLGAGMASISLFAISLFLPAGASPGLLERIALVAGSGEVLLYAQRLRTTLNGVPSWNRQEVAAL